MQISVVVPAYNEADNIPVLVRELTRELHGFGEFEIIIVDDGSTDRTLEILVELASQNNAVKYVSFSRNFGHQAALRAGLSHSSGDCVISLDADMQHPVRLIPKMVSYWQEGYEVVATRRIDTDEVRGFKRLSSKTFYALMNFLSDVRVDPGSADFRLLDRKVVNLVNSLNEQEFFLRGIIPWAGFKSIAIEYRPNQRLYGRTKYKLRKMVAFALAGIVSNSIRPLRLATILAVVISTSSLAYAAFALAAYLSNGYVVQGWTSVAILISLIGSLQLFVLGVIGEYIGRILRESQGRPPFVVRKTNVPLELRVFENTRGAKTRQPLELI